MLNFDRKHVTHIYLYLDSNLISCRVYCPSDCVLTTNLHKRLLFIVCLLNIWLLWFVLWCVRHFVECCNVVFQKLKLTCLNYFVRLCNQTPHPLFCEKETFYDSVQSIYSSSAFVHLYFLFIILTISRFITFIPTLKRIFKEKKFAKKIKKYGQ